MRIFLLISSILICLSWSCNAPQNLMTAALIEDSIPDTGSSLSHDKPERAHQPSGLSNTIPVELESPIYTAEATTLNTDRDPESSPNFENIYLDKIYLPLIDSVVVKSTEMAVLKEADQSFTYGFTSFIALIASLLLSLSGILLFLYIFALASVILGIMGLAKGVKAKRIIAQNETKYSNAKRANFGIFWSLWIFVMILVAAGIFLYFILFFSM